MRKYFIHLYVLTIFLTGSAAHAQSNMYVDVHGGLTVLESVDSNVTSGTPLFAVGPFDFSSETGVNGGVSVGVRMNQVRFEGEITYRDNDITELTDIFGTDGMDGSYSSVGFLANAYYDFNYSPLVKPYVGVGAGFAKVYANDLAITTPQSFPEVDDDDTVIAYKIAAGIAYSVTPQVEVIVDYHYFATTDPEFSTIDGTGRFDSEYKTHNINLGVRYNF